MDLFNESNSISNGVHPAPEKDYLSRLLWNERFFPMKHKKLSGGLLAAEVIIPAKQLLSYLNQAQAIAGLFGLKLPYEVHIINHGEEALLIMSISTDQTKTVAYLKHLFLVLLLTRLSNHYHGRPYGLGLHLSALIKQKYLPEPLKEYQKYKNQIDPSFLVNPGKVFSASQQNMTMRLLFNRFLLPTSLDSILYLLKYLGLSALGKWLYQVRPSPLPSKPVLPARTTEDLPDLAFGQAGIRSGGPSAKSSRTNPPGCHLYEAIYTCARCGACLEVCPAYKLLNDEEVSARGKLILADKIINNQIYSFGDEEGIRKKMEKLFACMHCHCCEEVCQSHIELVKAWDDLERYIYQYIGRPKQFIGNFIAELEKSPVYKEWLQDSNILTERDPLPYRKV